MLRSAAAGGELQQEMLSTSGRADIDAVCFSEIERLNKIFDVSAAFGFCDDDAGANALAVDRAYVAEHKDGTVLLGRLLAKQLAENDARANSAALIAVLAHEWGHIRQYKSRVVSNWGVHFELSADYLAGWYLSYRSDIDQSTIEKVVRLFSGIGDNHFTNEDHHGTPSQRSRMLTFAYNSNQSPDVMPESDEPVVTKAPTTGGALDALYMSLRIQN